jgi:ferredoxin
MPSARSFIVVAVRLLDGVVDTTTTTCRTTTVQGNFAYVYLNRKLHDITFGLASWLEECGYRSAPLGYNIGSRYNHKADADDAIMGPAYGLFSMKRAAILAGLGRRAKNGLVASPKFGTRIRLGAVLTAAALESDPLAEGEACPPHCDVCMRVCPTSAISRDGDVSHLRCFSDAGRMGTDYGALKTEMKKRYPSDLPGEDYLLNDFLAIDGNGHRLCKIACVAMCPLGEHTMPDIIGRAKHFDTVVPKVTLQGFPEAHRPTTPSEGGKGIEPYTVLSRYGPYQLAVHSAVLQRKPTFG